MLAAFTFENGETKDRDTGRFQGDDGFWACGIRRLCARGKGCGEIALQP
jgi:hypothetical protein